MKRRSFLLSCTGLVAAGALSACSVSTSGGATTVTIDVAKIVTDGTAIDSALQSAVAAPAIAILIGPYLPAVQLALAGISAALSTLGSMVGPAATLAVDTTAVQTLVSTISADANKVITTVSGVISSITGAAGTPANSTLTQIQNYLAAAGVLVQVITIAAGFDSTKMVAASMSESDALAIARANPTYK